MSPTTGNTKSCSCLSSGALVHKKSGFLIVSLLLEWPSCFEDAGVERETEKDRMRERRASVMLWWEGSVCNVNGVLMFEFIARVN